jgi:hypothetical protein
MAAMSVFGTSRFTALFAAVALSGTGGTFWWALETRSELKAVAAHRTVNHALPAKPAMHAAPPKEERSGKFEANKFDTNKFEANKSEPKFELMGKSSERPQPNFPLPSPAGNEGQAQASDRSIRPRLLANDPASGGYDPGSGQARAQDLRQDLRLPNSGADMPLPAMPAGPGLTPSRSDFLPWQVKLPDPQPSALPLPVPSPSLPAPSAEASKHQARELRTEPAAARPSKQPSRSFYTEQVIEGGEFHYRRHPCEPPNMPDVCFMPPADRHPIVAAKP